MEMKFAVRFKDDDRAKIACKIAETVQRSNSEGLITRGEKTRNAGSILMVMSLGLKDGDVVTVKSDNAKCIYEICNILRETK